MSWLTRIGSWQELVIGLSVRIMVIFLVMPVHEYAHAWMANRLGDDTAKRMGRLTLNPLAHINWLGAACIILFGFGWANPVPVNPFRFDNQAKRKRGMALTALAGPTSNLIVAFIGFIAMAILSLITIKSKTLDFIYIGFYYLASINISLAVFNLLPVFPLDGSRILGGILPDKWNNFLERNSQVVSIVTMAIIFTGVLSPVVNFLFNIVSKLMLGLVGLIFRLFGF